MPFYVDQSSNTICYAGNSFALPNTVQEAVNIDFLVTAPLKIHYNLYDLVDTLAVPISTTASISTPQVITKPSVSTDDEHNPHPTSVRSKFSLVDFSSFFLFVIVILMVVRKPYSFFFVFLFFFSVSTMITMPIHLHPPLPPVLLRIPSLHHFRCPCLLSQMI